MKKKIVFLWPGISGYMAACWREFGKCKEYETHVLVSWFETPWKSDICHGIQNFTRLYRNDVAKSSELIKIIDSINPDIIVVGGWIFKSYMKAALHYSILNKKLVLGMDTPWLGNIKQYIGLYPLSRYFKFFSMVVVTGERSFIYAKKINKSIPVRKGLYGIDFDMYSEASTKRSSKPWPKQFLFVGRQDPIKGVDILIDAYRVYRGKVKHPWPLVCCGTGRLSEELTNCEGIINKGFAQPADLVDIMAESGAFVLPSRFDPWPLVILEACAAGLPVLASNACGSSVENVVDSFNGLIFESGSVDALVNAFINAHDNYENLSDWGARSSFFASAYSPSSWAAKWSSYLKNI